MPNKTKVVGVEEVEPSSGGQSGSVCVIVLGDIGHSPRMQNHAVSFTRHNYSVDFIGYGGSKPHDRVTKNPSIRLRRMLQPPKFIQKFPKLLGYLVKIIWQIVTLFLVLMLVTRPKYMILQNPPAIPSLFVCLLVSKLRSSRLIVDWHNYGYTIMSMSHGPTSPIVRVARRYERTLGRFSKYNICVSGAMKQDLAQNWAIEAALMYDRPSDKFRRLSLQDQHELFVKLSRDIPELGHEAEAESSAFTVRNDQEEVVSRPNRPALLVSGTSWTEDEDFSVLLGALEDYNESAALCNDLPKVVCVITGKGPLKSFYQRLISEKNLGHVKIITPWLTAEDYPKLLGSADMGVCLHKSSSGLDLPMKVVDMFGSQLPVCAIKYDCIHELVKHDVNGLIFKDVTELAEQIQGILRGFPGDQSKLDRYRDNLRVFDQHRWDEAWDHNVLPLLA